MKGQGNGNFIPTIAIVTINKGNLDGLRKTIESTRAQNYKPDEYIMVDGTSVHGSFNYIAYERRYGSITHLHGNAQGV